MISTQLKFYFQTDGKFALFARKMERSIFGLSPSDLHQPKDCLLVVMVALKLTKTLLQRATGDYLVTMENGTVFNADDFRTDVWPSRVTCM